MNRPHWTYGLLLALLIEATAVLLVLSIAAVVHSAIGWER